ncbi:hypothetical protein CRD60_02470 [Bifidobacterium aemilianum]|uniref:Uncharacterized protein n=2 Tax=Bifidobacterium aemilianum TaxID=2493120 RepID=A0A366K9Q4_9BIFI|nr:hypothetical protein CRD60_02470 [Bifidobacterium aemilianum]
MLAVSLVAHWSPWGRTHGWVHGLMAVLGMVGIFLVWFFGSMLTDGLVDVLIAKQEHPLLNEMMGEIIGYLFLAALLLLVFVDVKGALLSALIGTGLAVVLGLLTNMIMEGHDEHADGQDTDAPQ